MEPPSDTGANLAKPALLIQQFAFCCRIQDRGRCSRLPGGITDGEQQGPAQSAPPVARPDRHIENAGQIPVEKRTGGTSEAAVDSGRGMPATIGSGAGE